MPKSPPMPSMESLVTTPKRGLKTLSGPMGGAGAGGASASARAGAAAGVGATASSATSAGGAATIAIRNSNNEMSLRGTVYPLAPVTDQGSKNVEGRVQRLWFGHEGRANNGRAGTKESDD